MKVVRIATILFFGIFVFSSCQEDEAGEFEVEVKDEQNSRAMPGEGLRKASN